MRNNNENMIIFNMLSAELEVAILILEIILAPREHRYRTHPLLSNRERQGFHNNLVMELRLGDQGQFKNYHRMSKEEFNQLLGIVGSSLQKDNTRRDVISPAERLSLTVRYLASGDSMISLGRYSYRVGLSTTSKIINETCEVLWEKLGKTELCIPDEVKWKEIAKDFFDLWNFPNCLGAIDGKHVVVQAFPNGNSTHYNYKNSHSIVLLAVCDARYKFVFVDIGSSGRNSDGGNFRRSNFGVGIINKSSFLNMPDFSVLPGTSVSNPYTFVGDEAFPLLTNLMRPYPGRATGSLPLEQKIFNYRLSRARRMIENTFGILVSKWRIYRRPLIASKNTTINIVKATICLHNWLKSNSSVYFQHNSVDTVDPSGKIIPGNWRMDSNQHLGLRELGRTGSNFSSDTAVDVRNKLKHYFSNENILPWQVRHINFQ